MKIRKLFKAETAHIVRNAYTKRCAKNIHGHSYKYELFLSGLPSDNAQMITDFTFVKKYFNPLFDSFDHSLILWSKDNDKILQFCKENFQRVIISNWNSTAEMQSLFFADVCKHIILYLNEKQKWENNESEIFFDSVIVHETETGYAQCNYSDLNNMNLKLNTEFSFDIMNDWTDEFKDFWKWYCDKKING